MSAIRATQQIHGEVAGALVFAAASAFAAWQQSRSEADVDEAITILNNTIHRLTAQLKNTSAELSRTTESLRAAYAESSRLREELDELEDDFEDVQAEARFLRDKLAKHGIA